MPNSTVAQPTAAQRRLKVHGVALQVAIGSLALLTLLLFSSLVVSLIAQEPQRQAKKPAVDLKSIPPELMPPPMKEAAPAAGARVNQHLPADKGAKQPVSKLYHALYLPTNWTADRRWPVLVEYPGNGPYSNSLGDTNSGLVEDCNLAYGLSGGKDFICLTLPFVNAETGENQRQWWGDADATVDYCLAAVHLICDKFGGDAERLVLCGFSRGAIACNYIGLRNDKIAALWKCFVVHSHYDGVRRWPYDDSDSDSARKRLARLKGRAQYITHEGSITATEDFLTAAQQGAGRELGKFTLVALPFPNHTDTWVLRDIEPRREVRAWLREQLGS